MRNVWSSANDPVFFLHHAQVDHVWAIWQNLSDANFHAYGGPVYPNGTGVSTLDSLLYMAPYVTPDRPVRDVMDTVNKDGTGFLCYVYEDNPSQKIPVSS
jgi:tyrosinase